ncbi:MAG: hypothetical protein J6K97_00715 [Clostridia bacterium]|nr:hypothetical protein [Clostridia bacterium]
MKKKFIAIFMLVCCLFCVGCKEKGFDYSAAERDVYNTGGTLSFEYDKDTKSAIFGGEGEVVQYYQPDIAKGWNEEGCRVGIKILPPKGLKDYKAARATLDGEELEYKDFLLGDEIKYAVFQPIVSEEKRQIELIIKWTEKTKEHKYNIIIREGTTFLGKESF